MRFIQIISGWINRHFSNEEAIYLLVFVFVLAGLVFWLGGALAPVLTGLVIAFLLQGMVKRLQNLGAPEWLAIYTCFIVFVGVVVAAMLFLFPLI